MGLKVHNSKPLIPNAAEELLGDAYAVAQDSINALVTRAWKCDISGQESGARKHYVGAYIYHMLIEYARLIREQLDRYGLVGTGCNITAVSDQFKIPCVEDKLRCLSKDHNTDYVNIWASLKEVYGIDSQTENCTDCCPGVGEMVVSGEDECVAFILGECTTVSAAATSGEFAPCDFEKDDFTKPVGDDDEIYTDCD